MSKPNDGGPAFPFVSHGGVHEHQACLPGMTLRDYFAAKAMQGLCAGKWDSLACWEMARCAYAQADDMLAERSKDHE